MLTSPREVFLELPGLFIQERPEQEQFVDVF